MKTEIQGITVFDSAAYNTPIPVRPEGPYPPRPCVVEACGQKFHHDPERPDRTRQYFTGDARGRA